MLTPLSKLSLPFVFLFTAAAPAIAAPLPTDETARVLAGLSPDSLPVDAARKKLAKGYAKTATDAWGKYWKRIGQPMTDWAETALPRTAGETIFYPFAGPDLPTAVQLYPDAGRYVLVALQTGGRVPDLAGMDEKQFNAYINLFKRAWTDFARRGFFRTDDLKADTGKERTLEGITPVLMAFASRLGYRVDAVEPIRIKADGSDVEVHPGDKNTVATWDSVRLTLDKDGKKVIADYLFLDLSDSHLKKHEGDRKWLEKMAGHKVFTKAASHLMQKSFFSLVRDTLLANAPSIVQDETGLDYKDLVKGFEVKLFGRFERAHKLWTEGVQRELAAAYKSEKDIPSLRFKFGYEKDAGSCVMVAIRKP